jgi:hypothetical protein
MRVMLLIAAAFVVTAQAAAAQTGPLQIGPAAGVAITTFVGSDADDADSRTSPYFGASVVYHPVLAMLGFESGVYYVQKGASTRFEGATGTLKLTYIEIPLLLRLGMNLQNSAIRPYAALGGSIGFNTGCSVEAAFGGVSVSFDCDDPEMEGELAVRAVDFGISGGAGVDIPVGMRGVLTPSLRYTHGLTSVDDGTPRADLKNSAFQLGVSFRFSL